MHAAVLQSIPGDPTTAAGAVALVLGLAVLVYWGHSRRGTSRAENWPSTTGTVTESVVGTERERPVLEYEYEVDGQSYRNDSVWVSGQSASYQRLRSLVESSPPGTEVTVYYDPDSPDVSLMVGGTEWRLGLLAVGLVLVGVGAALLFLV